MKHINIEMKNKSLDMIIDETTIQLFKLHHANPNKPLFKQTLSYASVRSYVASLINEKIKKGVNND